MLKVLQRSRTGVDQLTLEVAKKWLRVDGTADDDLITSLITESMEIIETYINQTITRATITLLASAREELILPYTPVMSISSVVDHHAQRVDYTWDGFSIKFNLGTYSVTSGSSLYVDTVTEYNAGYDNVPDKIMVAWKEVLANLYESRGDYDKINMMLIQNANLMQLREKVWI
jgi:uncharacterized phiE125 gp8 family phage protein